MQFQVFSNGPVKMWRIEKGVNRFRFQTTNPVAVRRMRQRQSFQLFGEQLNGPLRIFDASLYDLKSAKRALNAIAKGLGNQCHSSEKKCPPAKPFRSKTGHISTPTSQSVTNREIAESGPVGKIAL